VKQRVKSFIFAIGLMISAFATPLAAQQSWIQVESQRTVTATRDRAQFFATTLPDTRAFLTKTGWYAIVIGPMSGAQAKTTLARLKSSGQIPPDSLITKGESYISQLWPLSTGAQSPTTATEDTNPQPDASVGAALIPDPDLNATRKLERKWTRTQKKQYQSYLVWTGDYAGAIDGSYGRGTRRSIRSFQTRNGFQPTGWMTGQQRDLLVKQHDDAYARLGVEKVRNLDAGIEILMPTNLVAFSRFEPPFAIYGAKNDSKVEVRLISQKANAATLADLYDRMSAMDFVPADGYRRKKRTWFVLSGRNDRVVSYTYVKLKKGLLKGFSLIWPPEQSRDMQPLATMMYDSFTPIQNYVLGDTVREDTGENGPQDLASGLDTPEPDRAQSGFRVNADGIIITSATAVQGCSRLTSNDGATNLEVLSQSALLKLAVLRPETPTSNAAYALFSDEAPDPGVPVSVAGFSYPEVMDIAALNYGTLTDVGTTAGNPNDIRVSAYLEAGDTGGPVLDDRGAVIGMQMHPAADATPANAANVVLKARSITDLLDSQKITYQINRGLDSISAEDMADMAGKFTVKISCWK